MKDQQVMRTMGQKELLLLAKQLQQKSNYPCSAKGAAKVLHAN
jgi:tRNA C32,U32 (ribose-2'-O)-methylase TrmJ